MAETLRGPAVGSRVHIGLLPYRGLGGRSLQFLVTANLGATAQRFHATAVGCRAHARRRQSGTAQEPVIGTAGAAALGIGYATLVERNAFTLRETSMAVLEPGSATLRVLHISDLHMMPGQRMKQNWLRELDRLEPDLVVNTGDNLSHQRAVPSVVQALGPLLSRPGLFVFGSNDYFAPKPKNPFRYFDKNHKRTTGESLPWRDLRAAFSERGWLDVTHVRRELEVAGVRIASAGVDDPHLKRDRYDTIAGQPNPLADLRLGITHSPSPGCWTSSRRTVTTSSSPGTPTAASCACRSTVRW